MLHRTPVHLNIETLVLFLFYLRYFFGLFHSKKYIYMKDIKVFQFFLILEYKIGCGSLRCFKQGLNLQHLQQQTPHVTHTSVVSTTFSV